MKIGAIPAFRVAGPINIAIAPARASLVVLHVRQHIIINSPGLGYIRGLACCHLRRKFADALIEWHQMIRLQPTFEIRKILFRCAGYVRKRVIQMLVAPNSEFHRDGDGARTRVLNVNMRHLIPVFSSGHNLNRVRSCHFSFQNFLVVVTLRIRQPDLHIFRSRRDVVNLSRISKLEGPFLQRRSGRRRTKKQERSCYRKNRSQHKTEPLFSVEPTFYPQWPSGNKRLYFLPLSFWGIVQRKLVVSFPKRRLQTISLRMFSRKFIERGSTCGTPFTHLFRVAANSHAEMLRSVEKTPRSDAGLIFFQQELAKSVSVPTGELREHDAPRLRSNRQQIFSRAEKIP